MQAIVKSLLATVQGKQNILRQKYFQLSQTPLLSANFRKFSSQFENYVILVLNLKRILRIQYYSDQSQHNGHFKCVHTLEHNQSHGKCPDMMGEARVQVPMTPIQHQAVRIKHENLINQVISWMLESITDIKSSNPEYEYTCIQWITPLCSNSTNCRQCAQQLMEMMTYKQKL